MAFLTRNTFDYRCRLMRGMMDAHRLDALAFLGSDFFQWATNFHVDVQTWERPIAVVVPRDGEPFALMNEPFDPSSAVRAGARHDVGGRGHDLQRAPAARATRAAALAMG
jgi:hypothetical protein